MIKKIKNSLLILFIIFCCQKVSAQDYSYIHYGVEDGLPSSEVYSTFQDSKGYLWFATDAGISRFNGYEFENFDTSDGLTDNTVFLITEDHKGRIWFGTFNLKFCYYENGTIYPFKYNNEIANKKIPKRAIQTFHVDKVENIWISFFADGIYKIDKNGKVNQMIKIPKGIDWVNKEIIIENKPIRGSISGKEFQENRKKLKNFSFKLLYEREGCDDYNSQANYYDNITNLKSEKIDSSLLLIIGNNVKLINNKGIGQSIRSSLELTKNIYSLMSDDNFIWICQESGVSKCIIKDNQLILVDHFLENQPVSRVYKDKNRGFWFMTLKNGIYYLSNEFVSIVKRGPISAVEVDSTSGTLYTAIEKKVVKNQIGNLREELILDQVEVAELKYNYFKNLLLIGTIGFHVQRLNNLKKFSSIGKHRRYSAKSFLIDSHVIYKVTQAGLGIIKNDTDIEDLFYREQTQMWSTSLVKNNDEIWIGTNEGIKVYKNKTINSPYKENKYLSSAITCMERLNQDFVLIGTKSYGLLVLKNDRIVDVINEKIGLSGDLVKTIHVDYQQEIWVGTNSGLNKIKYKEENNFKLQSLTAKHGLISEEITDISSYRNTIYLATPKGLIEFDKTRIKANIEPPDIYITAFKVNTQKRELSKLIDLTYKENFITIHFDGINYRSLGEVEYQYRMLGVDSNWTSTTTRMIQYPTLQSGEYSFEVKAKNEDGFWSKPAILSFTINPPFWLKWWFILILIVVVLAIIVLIVIYREKQIRIKERAEKRIVELELKALRSQMNPHFIFNTLNSIQNYIAINDFKSSNKYITQFARLIRTVLNLSEKNMITIQEEVDVLKMYMDIERMRFEEQFDYEINIGDEIDSEYDKIPSMLIQPYVENAIWHGLMNKNEKGQIKIEIKIKENYLCCSIEDNGIGRKRAAEITANRKIEHKSVGMSITKERLDLISDAEINVEIIDIVDSIGIEVGTKVIVNIPYKD